MLNENFKVLNELMTLEETSSFLKVSKSYLYKLTSGKKIPYYKPAGKLIYFLKSEIEQWVFEGKILTCQETTNNLFTTLKTQNNGK